MKQTHKRYRKLFAAFTKGNPLVSGEFRVVNCAHDDWCNMLRSRGKEDCNCNPIFSYGPLHLGSFGTLHLVSAPPVAHN